MRANSVKMGNRHEHEHQGITYVRFEPSVEDEDGRKIGRHGEVDGGS